MAAESFKRLHEVADDDGVFDYYEVGGVWLGSTTEGCNVEKCLRGQPATNRI